MVNDGFIFFRTILFLFWIKKNKEAGRFWDFERLIIIYFMFPNTFFRRFFSFSMKSHWCAGIDLCVRWKEKKRNWNKEKHKQLLVEGTLNSRSVFLFVLTGLIHLRRFILKAISFIQTEDDCNNNAMTLWWSLRRSNQCVACSRSLANRTFSVALQVYRPMRHEHLLTSLTCCTLQVARAQRRKENRETRKNQS